MDSFSVTLFFLLLVTKFAANSCNFDFHNVLYSGLHLKAAAAHIPPFMIIQGVQSNRTYSGYGVDILQWLASHFRLIVEYVPVNQSEVAKFGLIQAVINQLVINKEVDIIPLNLISTPQRAQVMDFSMPILVGSSRMMLPYPKMENRTMAFVEPYSWIVWALIFLAAFSVICCMTSAGYFELVWFKETRHGKDIKRIFHYQSDYVITILLNQGNYLPYSTRLPMRYPAGLFCLMAVVFVNAYTGSLMSYMAVPKTTPIPQSFEELASSKKFKLTAEVNSAIADMFYNAKSGPYKIIGDSLRKNPQLLFRDFNQAKEIILKYEAACVRGGIEVVNRIADDMKVNKGKCRFTASRYLSDIVLLSFGLQKGSLYSKAVDIKLIPLRDAGLLDYWFKQYTPNIDRCLVTSSRYSSGPSVHQLPKAYNITDLSGAFLLLIIGISVSLCVFLFDLVAIRAKRIAGNLKDQNLFSS